MAFLTQRFIQSSLTLPSTINAAQEFEKPDVVVLPVRDGCTPCNKPPVRIFLGTEAAQYKAERVFIWSIEKVRDPSRVYEIHLMKHLRGFKPRYWLTGFTNYRFAIPHFAGGTGRAIYNDVDQIYLKDPGELFDLELGDHGYLAIDPGDISVALFDCERMARIWSLKDAQTGSKNPLLARASSTPGLWGKLDGSWNARDREYVRGESGVLHYTALHRQPWQPFPQLFVYQRNSAANIWFELEQSANDAGYRVFSAAAPSQAFNVLSSIAQSSRHASNPEQGEKMAGPPASIGVTELLEECNVRSVLDCRIAALSGSTSLPTHAINFEQIQTLDLVAPDAITAITDAVVCHDALEFVADDDIPWLLEALFSRAGRLLICSVDQSSGDRVLADGTSIKNRARSIEWWQYQFELVSRHHSNVRWRLCLKEKQSFGSAKPTILDGNECGDGSATVWVLQNRKPGHSSQATALADLIGMPYQTISVPQRFKSLLLVLLRLRFGQVDPLRRPWPNIIVACGWWPTRVARWIKMRSDQQVRLLLAGRKCGPIKDPTDILVSCEHFRLPVHDRRIQTLLPVHPITESRLHKARDRGERLMGDSARPRIALLVGGSSKQHVLTKDDATTMGARVLEQVQAAGGTLFAVTSRRTGRKAATALATTLQDSAQLHVWSPDETDNPYLSYLAAADILIVSGESESMLMDAIATNKPVYIYPLRQRHYGPWLTLGAKLAEWSERRPKNRRGTERPQQGFEYFCSRILKKEWILPPRDLEGLHRRLVEQGYAQMFGGPLSEARTVQTPTIDDLGQQIRTRLAIPTNDVGVQQNAPYSHDVTIQA